MKRILALACAAALMLGVASAQPNGPPGSQGQGYQGQGYQGQGQQGGPGRGHFAPESESESNSLSFLLGHNYQVAAGWEGTLVLQRADRVYLCPYTRYRNGNSQSSGMYTSQMCQHIREGIQF